MATIFYISLFIFYAALFCFIIYKARLFEIENIGRKNLVFFFGLKIAAGMLLTLIYTYYYTDESKADIYRFFNDSKVITSVLFHSPLAWFKIMSGIGTYDNDAFSYLVNTQYFSHPAADFATSNSFLIRFISLLNFFSFTNIFIDTLFFNFMTFVGLVMLFKVLQPHFKGFDKLLCVPLFLIPSIIFWSSGLLKEALLLCGISFYLYLWLTADSRNLIRNIGLLVLVVLIIMSLKLYVAALLAFCSIFLPLRKSISGLPFPLVRRSAIFILILAGFWYFLSPRFCEKIIDKRNEFILLAVSENAGSSLDNQQIDPDCTHLLSIIPLGMENAVLRPFVWERGKLFQKLFAFETLLQFVIIALLLPFWKRESGAKLWLALFCFSFAVFNYLMIGLTIPVLGAIVHYRIIAILFLQLGILLVTDFDKIKSKLASIGNKT